MDYQSRRGSDDSGMPRRAKGPRLYLDPQRRTWIIRDGSSSVRTGCAEGAFAQAEAALGHYIASKYRPSRSESPALSDVLLAYGREHVPHKSSAAKIEHTIANLERWWGDKMLTDVTARNCRAYAETRPSVAARRDLETLRAAIGYWHREYGPLPSVPAVTLPPKPEPRSNWLTRAEARRLRHAAKNMPHLYRFIVLGLLTGSRAGVLLGLKWSAIDLDRGIMVRLARGELESATKRRPPVRLNAAMTRLMRRWKAKDGSAVAHVIHYDGKPVRKLRRSWETCRIAAGLPKGVSPHTLRHTRATWLMQAGVDLWQAAGSLGMSVRTMERVYGHHHPEFQKDAAAVGAA